jgi:drug/metabolite transporter (DMT)-like permease
MLSENVAIVHSAPILATLLAVPFLGEKLGLHRMAAVALGFLGVLVIVKPGSDLFKLESLFPLAAAFFMAISYLATRFLMSTESSVSIIFHYSLALFITSIVFFPNDFVIPSLYNLIPLMSLGVMGSLGHYFIAQATKSAEVVVIAPFEYTSFIFLGIMGYFFYNEVPDSSVFIGMLLIVLSGIYIVYREQQKKKNIVSETILKNTR